eukprot:TRINITY_DN33501_c0_g1_i2.p1 TRINITY_DN33501_c0_g1~~TRINITY_DN33501_c0_g1_i2.p1  ORF type:complete len:386 (+),score=103.82 TRINITY_DN33501_c0_g1_i2:82-1158(+)
MAGGSRAARAVCCAVAAAVVCFVTFGDGVFLPGGLWWWLFPREPPGGVARPPRGAASAPHAPPGRKVRVAVLGVTAPARYGKHGGVQWAWRWQGPMSTRNKLYYCQRHNYALRIGGHETLDDGPAVKRRGSRIVLTGNRAPQWGKVRQAQKYMKDFDWLVWIDTDTLIMDLARKVEDMIPTDPEKHLVISPEPQPGSHLGFDLIPNTGVWLMRNWFLQSAWDFPGDKNHQWGDQEGFLWMVRHSANASDVLRHIQWVSAHAINARPAACMRGWTGVGTVINQSSWDALLEMCGWQEGDWIVHTNRATCRTIKDFPGMTSCEDCWKEYWERMLRLNRLADSDFPKVTEEQLTGLNWGPV